VFLLIANEQDLPNKMKWAESLSKSYQNSKVIIRLISTNKMNPPESYPENIDLIHHPSNRPIEAHILIIQQSKLNQCEEFYYITHEDSGKLSTTEEHQPTHCVPIQNNGLTVGFLINTTQLNAAIRADINTVNKLRGLLNN